MGVCGEPGGTLRNVCWGGGLARFSKHRPYFRPKDVIFQYTLFSDLYIYIYERKPVVTTVVYAGIAAKLKWV